MKWIDRQQFSGAAHSSKGSHSHRPSKKCALADLPDSLAALAKSGQISIRSCRLRHGRIWSGGGGAKTLQPMRVGHRHLVPIGPSITELRIESHKGQLVEHPLIEHLRQGQ